MECSVSFDSRLQSRSLNEPAEESASARRHVLQTSCGGQSPDASHGDTEKRTDGEESREGLYEARSERENGADEQIGDDCDVIERSAQDHPGLHSER